MDEDHALIREVLKAQCLELRSNKVILMMKKANWL